MTQLHRYILGFALSILLTLFAFGLVVYFSVSLSPRVLMSGIVVFAVAQLLVQLLFFLHLGGAWKLWNISALLFSILIIVLVAGGTLWVMTHLEHNLHSPFDGTPSPQTQHG